MDSFGSFLKEKREQKSLSLQDLSDLLGQKEKEIGWYPDKSRLSRWETGRALPTAKHRPVLLAMAKILDMEPAEESEWLVKAGLPPLQTEELDMSAIDSTLSSMGERRRKAWYLHKYLGWDVGRISSKLKAASWDIRRDIEEVKDELEKLVGKVEDLPSVATQLKAQLFLPAPELILIDTDNFVPGTRRSIPLKRDIFRVLCQNLGYDISKFEVYKESSETATGDIQINVAVSDYGVLELFCPVEEHPLFPKLLSSLSEPVQQQFPTWKQRGGEGITMCSDIRREIHTEANGSTPQSAYETVVRLIPGIFKPSELPPSPLTANFGNLVYRLCILYRRTSGQFGLPGKEQYITRPRGPFLELCLGQIHLATVPNPPFPPPPPYTAWSQFLEGWADLHRDMIRKWSASPAIIELLGLFESLHGIEEAIKQELDDIIRGK